MVEDDNARAEDLTASHASPEGRVPCNDLRNVVDSWRWLQEQYDDRERDDDVMAAFFDGYVTALNHATADIQRQINNNE